MSGAMVTHRTVVRRTQRYVRELAELGRREGVTNKRLASILGVDGPRLCRLRGRHLVRINSRVVFRVFEVVGREDLLPRDMRKELEVVRHG